MIQQELVFDGVDVKPVFDRDRLSGQLLDVFDFMSDQEWHTLRDIEEGTCHGQASISAQLRNLRKARYGGHVIERRRSQFKESGLYYYRLNNGGRE